MEDIIQAAILFEWIQIWFNAIDPWKLTPVVPMLNTPDVAWVAKLIACWKMPSIGTPGMDWEEVGRTGLELFVGEQAKAASKYHFAMIIFLNK